MILNKINTQMLVDEYQIEKQKLVEKINGLITLQNSSDYDLELMINQNRWKLENLERVINQLTIKLKYMR